MLADNARVTGNLEETLRSACKVRVFGKVKIYFSGSTEDAHQGS
jgi:hypothetical protein